jgi:peptidoglycan/xylan/chitin deacetylase (PgdA/CDA1 family)
MSRIVGSIMISLAIIITSSCGNNQVEEVSPKVTEEIEEVKANQENEIESSNEDIEKEDSRNLESSTESAPVQQPLYKINEMNWRVEPIDSSINHKVVLLTIDDAPDQYGLEMAQLLKQLRVNAIFFINGHFIDSPEEKEVLKRIHELGFEIGNHTWNHKNLKELSEQEQYDEIVTLNDEIEGIIGERPKFFRAPFGANTDYAKELVRNQGMTLMNWTFGYDFMKNYMTKESLETIMLNTELLTNGANILMHDREWTKEALPQIVEGLREKGYEIVDPKLIQTPIP